MKAIGNPWGFAFSLKGLLIPNDDLHFLINGFNHLAESVARPIHLCPV